MTGEPDADGVSKARSAAEIAGEVARVKIKRRSVKYFRVWYARVDSNHRPFAPEANALSS